MDHSMAQPRERTALWNLPAWKSVSNILAAVLLSLLFLVSGLWKVTDPLGAATKMNQALVPYILSLPTAICFGIAETFAGLLLLVPRYRRWGACLAGLLLIAFLGYFAVNYNALSGDDCSCFPWIKRVVGPSFFIGDGVMLLLAVLAGAWARPSQGLRTAAIILGLVAVSSGVSYGVNVARQSGRRAPDQITVNGKPFSLQSGRIFIYFYDPECMHCDQAARNMAQYAWKDVKLIAVPVVNPQFAAVFLHDTGFPAMTSVDVVKLRSVSKFDNAPYAVALEHGREKATLREFDEQEPAKSLRELGFVR